jgi:hypothetical protein
VTAVAWSPDGRLLARGSTAQVFLWHSVTGEELTPLPAAPGQVLGLSFSPDGRFLAAATGDLAEPLKPSEVTVWEVASRKEVLAFREHTSLAQSVAFAPEGAAGARGRRVASSAYDGTIKLWDAFTGKVEHTLRGQGRNVWVVCFSPDGTRLASCGGGGKVWVWDTVTGRKLFACGHAEASTSSRDVVFSPDGKYLVTADLSSVRVWDAATGGDPAAGRRTLGEGTVDRLAFSSDGKYLAGIYLYREQVVVWDFATGAAVLRYPAVDSKAVSALAFRPESGLPGRRLAVSSPEAVDVWDVDEKWQTAEAERRRQERPRLIAWHLGQAQEPYWFAARFHRSCLIALEPQEGAHYLGRADANAELGRWDEAAADAARAVELVPDSSGTWHREALLHLRAGDLARYRQTCDAMFRRLGQTRDWATLNDLVWVCCLGPGAPSDPKSVVALAERSVTPGANADNLLSSTALP